MAVSPVRRTGSMLALLSAALLAACAGEESNTVPATQEFAPPQDAAAAAGEAGGAATAAAGEARLVPASATLTQVNDLVRDPAKDPLPDDSVLAAQIRLGYNIVRNTREHAGRYVGNQLNCSNCHLNAGQRDRALPYVGVAATFPQYRSRDGEIISLESRIRDCFARSLNGTRPPLDSPELMAVSAYVTWLSQGLPMGEEPAWRGKNNIAKEKRIPIEQLDVKRGEQLYAQQCAACHAADGQGVDLKVAKPGPLWGPQSWNDGAGLGRIYTLAGYIRYAMPLTTPGSLSDEDAQHIAAFIDSHERPRFAEKEKDFPNGDVPIDAVYYPQRYKSNPLMRQ